MHIYRFLDDLPKFKNPILTIGTFDGVHQGHQEIISKINTLAKDKGGDSVLLTFHPHPRLIINPDDTSLKLITTFEEKKELLKAFGINVLLLGNFSRDFAQIEPEVYLIDYLIKKVHPSVIVVGYDHRFGKNRTGDIQLIKKYAQQYDYEVVEIPKHMVLDIGVSSTKVREAITNGEMAKALELLGHPYTFTGKVISGHGIGKQIGFPTANLFVEDPNKLLPGPGIFATNLEVNNNTYKGMLYIGNRPTFEGMETVIEVNVLDFEGDLYESTMKVRPVAKIRDDEKFDTVDELTIKMEEDRRKAMEILSKP